MDKSSDVFDARLHHPFSMLVCGAPLSGKTQFVKNLIYHKHTHINPPPANIVWFYGEHTIDENEISQMATLVPGVPNNFDEYIDDSVPNLFIFDDLMMETTDSKKITGLFTRQSHHRNTSVILILQDLFYGGSQRKSIYRSVHYLTLFASPLDKSMIYSIANKLMPKNAGVFFDIFEEATSRMPHGYLFIDGKPNTPINAKLRTDIFKPFQRSYSITKVNKLN